MAVLDGKTRDDLVEDVLEILSSRYYTKGITKTDLLNELRQNVMKANVRLTRRWSIGGWGVGDIFHTLEDAGFTITYTPHGSGYKTTVTI